MVYCNRGPYRPVPFGKVSHVSSGIYLKYKKK